MNLHLKIRNVMLEKKSNLCVSLDYTYCQKILDVLELIQDYVVMIKIHCDIIRDFNFDFIHQLVSICERKNIFILEDRKFADIGHIFKQQFYQGFYRIQSWCHIITMHSLLGSGPIHQFRDCKRENQAILLIAQLSNQGNLIDSNYVNQSIKLAQENPEEVLGFICQNDNNPNHTNTHFLNFTPGVNRHQSNDSKDQRYVTPQKAIENGADIIIVGRGITQFQNEVLIEECKIYQNLAWQAYAERNKITEI